MREIEFIDKGLIRKRYDREASDDDEGMMGKIEFPNKVSITIDCGPFAKMLPTVDIATFRASLRKYKPLAVVNYIDMGYSLVIAEERCD